MKPLTEGLNMERPSLAELGRRFQKECHDHVEKVMAENRDISYQYATNAWMFLKLADMQIHIDRLVSWKLLHTPLK